LRQVKPACSFLHLPEGAQKGILHDSERSFSTPSEIPFFPNRNILCPMLLLGCRKYVAKNTLACQVFSRYRRKMLPKYAEKHLVTNRAAIPFIYLGACATPSNTRTNTQRRDRREREEQQDTNRQRKTPELQRKTNQSPLTTPPGRSMLDQRKLPQEMVIRGPSTMSSTMSSTGLCAGCPSSHTW